MHSAIHRLNSFYARVGARQVVRLVLAVGIMILWSVISLFYLMNSQVVADVQSGPQASASAPAVVAHPTTSAQTYSSASFYQVLAASARLCPAGRSIPLLSDYVPAYNLGNYYLYPRKLAFIQSSQSLDASALGSMRGGCLLTYGDTGAQRVAPLAPMLSLSTCSFDGCLYEVK